jgi:hypothetical protein
METRGIKPEYIAGNNKRQGTPENSSRFLSLSLASAPSKDDQRLLFEAFESLLPMLKGVASTRNARQTRLSRNVWIPKLHKLDL